MIYFYSQSGETYRVNDKGQISRQCLNWAYSGAWVCRGAVRFNNFGHAVEFMPFPLCFTHKLDWRYKNGKGRWFIADTDHGSQRVQMTPESWSGLSNEIEKNPERCA